MRRLIVLAALVASACGSESPTAPTIPTPPPIPAASLSSTGNLSVTGCLPSSANLYSCVGFAGAAVNSGPGCATGIRGLTTSYDATTKTQVASSNWAYTPMVRPGESFGYNGVTLVITGPVTGGWFYTTTMSWDNVKCP